jgi:hypothetical protein
MEERGLNFGAGTNRSSTRCATPSCHRHALKACSVTRTAGEPEAMSALPPKADMCGAASDVRFGPEADIPHFTRLPRQLATAAMAAL